MSPCSSPHTKKKIVCVRTEATDLEDLQHVKELPMNIANDSHWRGYVNDIALLHQHLLRFGAYCLDQGFCKEVFLVQLGDALVKVDTCYAQVSGRDQHVREVEKSVLGRPGIAKTV